MPNLRYKLDSAGAIANSDDLIQQTLGQKVSIQNLDVDENGAPLSGVVLVTLLQGGAQLGAGAAHPLSPGRAVEFDPCDGDKVKLVAVTGAPQCQVYVGPPTFERKAGTGH